MNAEQIRRLLRKRPFHPLEVLADGGARLVIRRPEAALVGRELIVVELPDGTMDYIEARNVSKVRVLPRRVSVR